jgi:hypothetical protein
MAIQSHHHPLAAAIAWWVLLLIAFGLLVYGRLIGLSPSAAALAAVAVLWAATVLPNATHVWGLSIDDGSAWRRRRRWSSQDLLESRLLTPSPQSWEGRNVRQSEHRKGSSGL